jgi:signal transduction histidine kinase
MKRRGLVTQVTFVSTVLATALVVVFTVLLLAILQLRESSAKARHTQQVIALANGVQTLVIDLETGLRGFVITDDRRLLKPFFEASRTYPRRMAKLERLVADEPEQERTVRKIRAATDDYVRTFGLQLLAFMSRNPAAARQIVRAGAGDRQVTRIRSMFDRLAAAERRIAAERDASARRNTNRAIGLAGTGAGLALVLVFLFAVYVARQIVRPIRQTATAARELAAGDLSSRVGIAGRGEVRALGESFNQMAASLERTRAHLEEQNRRLRESEHAKTELINTVSHELRTPLASILGFADVLLRRTEFGDDERRFLDLIRVESQRLATLLNDLLDVQRIEQGQIDLVRRWIDLNELVETQVALYSAQSERHEVEVHVPPEPTPVYADPGRLAQVIGNLLSNAIKYSPEGGPVAAEVIPSADFARVEVADHGLGIGAEHQARIFTKFFRGEAARLGIRGTGLGLALARQIVAAHGGRIGFLSTEGAGSTFWIEIPGAEGAEEAEVERISERHSQRAGGRQ